MGTSASGPPQLGLKSVSSIFQVLLGLLGVSNNLKRLLKLEKSVEHAQKAPKNKISDFYVCLRSVRSLSGLQVALRLPLGCPWVFLGCPGSLKT